MSRAVTSFSNVRSEGGLLPQDLLARIQAGDKTLPGLGPESYHLAPHERIVDAANRAWSRLVGLWRPFRDAVDREPGSAAATGLTRDRWLLPLFQELGYGRLPRAQAMELDGKSFAVSHTWHCSPIHLLGWNVDLDSRQAGVAGAARSAPHGLVQEFLNRSDQHLWGFLSNGKLLRILRDHHSLTRVAYVEFDLAAIMDGEHYSEFLLLWMLCHQSRVEADRPEECWLERWLATARDEGVSALDKIQAGVERAIKRLGSGFLAHSDNRALSDALQSGALDPQEYYRQVLRLVYRIIFLFVAEERDALLQPANADDPDDPRHAARDRYQRYYAARRIRALADKRRGGPHGDLWHRLRLVMDWLDEGCPELALPALGSGLWSNNRRTDQPDRGCPWIMDAACANEHLLDAIRHLSHFVDGKIRYPVNWRNMGAEELGSIYENLLELHPRIDKDAGSLELETAAGHVRKTTGSYYTPTSLVDCLLDTALDPVLDEAARQPDPERAILDLKVCDPACGSGHFLVAAARRMARRLASVRSGDTEPSPRDVQRALRDVVGQCIHGVDINPMAVELCKVSLWMEALEPGRPLSFLDSHIQHGNSLLGATPALMARGIPDDAWKPITGDDKAVARRLKKRNKDERKGQGTLFSGFAAAPAKDMSAVADLAAAIEAEPDDEIASVRKKAADWHRLTHSPEFQDARRRADFWCAAFVWPKQPGELEYGAPTEGLWQRLQQDASDAPKSTRETVPALARQYRLFHWHLAFPHVFRGVKDEIDDDDVTGWQGGFDVMLGNPPWEHIEIKEKEYFAQSRPDIAKAPNAAKRKKMIEALEKEDTVLFQAFQEALRAVDGEDQLLRATNRYPLCARGRLNTYAVFAELNRALLNPAGSVGCIAPSGIAMDANTQYFFRDLVESRTLASLYHFENEDRIFPGVHHAFRFCLLTLNGPARPVDESEFVAYARQATAVEDPERRYRLSAADFARLNPNTRNFPAFRGRRDAEITKSIYQRAPVLVNEEDTAGNPWQVTFRQGLFNMAGDSGLFRTRAQLQADGWQMKGNLFVRDGHRMLPLYEAKMVHHFDHRFGTYEGQSPAQAKQGKLPEATPEQHADPDFLPWSRYWVEEAEVESRLEGRWSRGWLLGWRDICRASDFRTVIAAVVPRAAVGHTTPLMLLADEHVTLSDCLIANLGSFALDYASRQKIGGTHLTFGLMQQLPVFAPAAYAEPCAWSPDASIADWLRPRVLELTYTAWDLHDFARDIGHEGPPFRWDDDRRFWLRAELDAAFFHLYGIARDDVDYIMDSFWVVHDRDVEAHGTYRTKEAILDIYDRLQRAMDTGEPYQTVLDPPPGDPRVAHPPRGQQHEPPAVLRLRDLHGKPAPAPPFVVELDAHEAPDDGPRRFRCQPLVELPPTAQELVLLQHPALTRGGQPVSAAAGYWRLNLLHDAATDQTLYKITLAGTSPPAELRLTEAEWNQLRPVGTLKPLDE